ncbi:MAG: FtsX-like permease family protein [Lachnospiraceae bacterium]|nr:FtsX-like permease family protein [Lachnospiraceae bacterium]
MKSALYKDILRTVWKEKKRFISILLITTLGVTMMTGLSAACEDLRYSADRFFDAQKLFDVSILSTLGLTEEDVEVLGAMEGVERAEGAYSEVVQTKKGDQNKTAEVKMLLQDGLNLPYLREGSLPSRADEIAVTENYMKDTGKRLGDRVRIEELMEEDEEEVSEKEEEVLEEEEEKPNFPVTDYTISGVVVDVTDINNAEGSAGFRATPNADYTFFVTEEAIESDVFTAVYLCLADADGLQCYSPAYEEKTSALIRIIEEEIMEQRERRRHEEITGEANEKIDDAEAEMREEFAEAEEEFTEAETEIADGWQEIEEGKRDLEEGLLELETEIADARAELDEAYVQLYDAWDKLTEGEKQLNIAQAELEQGKETLRQKEAEATAGLEAAAVRLEEQIAQNEAAGELVRQNYAAMKSGIEAAGGTWPETQWNAYVAAVQTAVGGFLAQNMTGENSSIDGAALQAAINADPAVQAAIQDLSMQLTALQMDQAAISDVLTLGASMGQTEATAGFLEAGRSNLQTQREYANQQIAAGWAQIEEGEREIQKGWEEISYGRGEVIRNLEEWEKGVAELEEKEQDARREIQEGWEEIAQAESELLEGEEELAENRIEYEEEKEKAEDKIREARAEVADIDMTQWYVQDRTSLSGYVNVDSDTACIESLAGIFAVVFYVVAILISLTTVTRMVEEERGLVGTYKALGFTDHEIRSKYVIYALGASVTGGVLGDIGGFIVLPRILFVFFKVMYLLPEYHLLFDPVSGSLGIVLFITGIVGAAVFACHTELKQMPAILMRPKAPRMGSRVLLERITFVWRRMSFLNKVTARNLFRYKKRLLMTVLGICGCTALVLFGFAIKDSVAELMPLQYETVYKYDLLAAVEQSDHEKLIRYVEEHRDAVEEYIPLLAESVKVKNAEGASEKIQMMVFPEEAPVEVYVTLPDQSGQPRRLTEEGILLTENAARILGVAEGDRVSVQKLDLTQKDTTVSGIVKNYLGNNIYLSEAAYRKIFEEFTPNAVLANLTLTREEQITFSETLSEENWILSSVSTEEMKEGFSAAFTLINLVVYVVLILAAGLAFVVLFTLASINISERERELATIKVLGFYDREVHQYVNKETLILTVLGILLGLPLGAALSSMLTDLLNMPSIYFQVTIYHPSFLYAAGISLGFAFLVQILTDRSLNVIDPVEALKSVE